jgi:hypothetical protein
VIAIAEDGSGNLLVLTVVGATASETLEAWDHETGELSPTGLTAASILVVAAAEAARLDGLRRRFGR